MRQLGYETGENVKSDYCSMYFRRKRFYSTLLVLMLCLVEFFVFFVFIYTEKYPEENASVFLYLWISASVFSSLYSYIWDIKMDWGLFDRNAEENKFLREEIVYSSTVRTSNNN